MLGPSAIGEFLELSLTAPDPLESLQFWQRAGFVSEDVGGAWRHPYAALTDGRIHVGVHKHALEVPSRPQGRGAPALTFVCHGLRERVAALEAHGIEFEFIHLGGDRFNELGFLDPDGHLVRLVEARTFSLAAEPPEHSRFGWFGEYRLPVRSAVDSAKYWESLGLLCAPHGRLGDARLLSCTGFNLGVHEDRALRAPALAFYDEGMGARVERLVESGVEVGRVRRARDGAFESAEVVSPEGLTILLFEGHL